MVFIQGLLVKAFRSFFAYQVKIDSMGRRSPMKNLRHIVRSPVFLMALTVFIDFTGFGLVLNSGLLG
jgi:hypothetical protein